MEDVVSVTTFYSIQGPGTCFLLDFRSELNMLALTGFG
jgi:hypothetical protein